MVVTQGETHRDSLTYVPSFTEQDIVLDDKYEYKDSLTAVLGYGAFGVVYKGINRSNSTNVAIKKVPRVNVKENELKVIRALKSPYLVGVLDICTLDDLTCCLVMECCTCDLEYHIQHVSTQGRLSDQNLRLIIDNLARGYKALYELKIVHRDLKPQNILVTYEGCSKQLATARITDFGIARTLDDMENSELCNVAGTFFYMAPEVGANLVKTCNYDSKIDMWSIGVLLYQCLTGQIPFNECSLCKLFLYTACDNFDAYDPPELPETTNVQVANIIHALLEIDYHRRCTPIEFYKQAIEYSEQQQVSAVVC